MKSASIVQDLLGFGRELRRFLGIILALLWREAEIRRQTPLNSILELFEPLVVIATIGLIRYLIHDVRSLSPLGGSMAFFLITGFYPKYLFLYVSNFMPRGSPRHRFPIEQRLDYIFVHIIYTVIEHIFFGLVIFGFIYFFITADAMPSDILPIIPALAASTALGFGWGMMNTALTRFLSFWRYFAGGVNRALIIFSGAIFLPDFLPPNVRYLFSFNPEVHAIALFRTAFYPHYPALILDTTYMTNFAIFFVLLGLVLERITRRFEGRQ